MATLNVVYGMARGNLNAYDATPVAAANVTTSGTSAQSAVTTMPCVARVTAIGGAMYVTAGVNPTATVGAGWYLGSGASIDLIMPVGHRLAIIDHS
jgi:hypothetical protein